MTFSREDPWDRIPASQMRTAFGPEPRLSFQFPKPATAVTCFTSETPATCTAMPTAGHESRNSQRDLEDPATEGLIRDDYHISGLRRNAQRAPVKQPPLPAYHEPSARITKVALLFAITVGPPA